MKFLTSSLSSTLLGGICFLLTMVLLLQKPLAATAKPDSEEEESGPVTFWERHNPEVDQLIEELRKQKQDITKREAELRELATRLQTERAEINLVTQRVAQLQLEFDQNVVRVKEDEAPNLKKLARMYSSMSPEAVSTIIKEMDDQTVVKLMSQMKETESAPLLESMTKEGEAQAKRAAAISEALRKTLVDKRKTP
jgi:flagellar motility protein MotE (MotC chaperone)